MKNPEFTIRVIASNPHRLNTIIWKAGNLVAAMEGCDALEIIRALSALERDTTKQGIGNPARWLSHFAGLESASSGKSITPWIEITYKKNVVKSLSNFRSIMKLESE